MKSYSNLPKHMRIKVVLFLALVSGLVFLSVRYAVRVPTTPAVPTVSDPSAPLQPGPKVGLSATLASRQKAPAQATDKVPPSQEALWDQPVAEPQFAAFKNWVGRYRQAASRIRASREQVRRRPPTFLTGEPHLQDRARTLVRQTRMRRASTCCFAIALVFA